MQKTILVTGSTDGIGLLSAQMLSAQGHRVLLHGRNPDKLQRAAAQMSGPVETLTCDLSRIGDVRAFADAVAAQHPSLDALVNNAGVFTTSHPRTADDLDIRFAVNTIAPYVLTKALLSNLGPDGRVVNVSSAAQSPVDLAALAGRTPLGDGQAYAQSKLAITAWSRAMSTQLEDGPMIVSVNPGSMLASKMVKDAYGVPGRDINIGGEILVRAAVSDEFATASGRYFDNDAGAFGPPHPDALDERIGADIIRVMEEILAAA